MVSTPTTVEVRHSYVQGEDAALRRDSGYGGPTLEEIRDTLENARKEFDAWLLTVQAEAWEDD